MVELVQGIIGWYEKRICANERIPKFIQTAIGWLVILVLIIPICLVGTVFAGILLWGSALVGTISYDQAREMWSDICSAMAEV